MSALVGALRRNLLEGRLGLPETHTDTQTHRHHVVKAPVCTGRETSDESVWAPPRAGARARQGRGAARENLWAKDTAEHPDPGQGPGISSQEDTSRPQPGGGMPGGAGRLTSPGLGPHSSCTEVCRQRTWGCQDMGQAPSSQPAGPETRGDQGSGHGWLQPPTASSPTATAPPGAGQHGALAASPAPL